MKKLLMTVACSCMFSGMAFADLPDFTKVWQEIRTGKISEAKDDLETLWSDYRASNEGKKWNQSHSDESSKDVEEWLHFSLLRFYIAYLEGVDSNIKLTASQIQQLSYLEYMGKPLVD